MRSWIVAAPIIAAMMSGANESRAQTVDEWIAIGTRVHGGYGAFIPLGVKIGLDAVARLKAEPRTLAVRYSDGEKAPCACFADGVAIATRASVGQRTLTIAPEKAPEGLAAVIEIRPRAGGTGWRYAIPTAVLPRLAQMNRDLDPAGRHAAVMAAEGLFEVVALD